METNDFMPEGNEEFDTFQGILYGYIVAHVPGTAAPWGYPQSRVDTMTVKKDRWDAAWLIGKDENLRNHGDVIEMQQAKADYESDMRDFVTEWIRNNSLIRDQVALQLLRDRRDVLSPGGPLKETPPLFKVKP